MIHDESEHDETRGESQGESDDDSSGSLRERLSTVEYPESMTAGSEVLTNLSELSNSPGERLLSKIKSVRFADDRDDSQDGNMYSSASCEEPIPPSPSTSALDASSPKIRTPTIASSALRRFTMGASQLRCFIQKYYYCWSSI